MWPKITVSSASVISRSFFMESWYVYTAKKHCNQILHGILQRPNQRSCKHSTCAVNITSSTSSGTNSSATAKFHTAAVRRISETVQQRRLGLCVHEGRLPPVIPASADLFITSTATDEASPMPNCKHPWGCPPRTWQKQITADTDTTTADALQLATGHPMWRAVTMAARLRAQWWLRLFYNTCIISIVHR